VVDAIVPPDILASKLALNTRVARVEQHPSCPGVLVQATDNRSFCGRHVVSTIPLGSMQRYHKEIFHSPSLPAKQASALNAFTMGNFTKIHAQFATNFWSSRGLQWLAEVSPDDVAGGPKEFHDLDVLIPGSNVLFTYVVPLCPRRPVAAAAARSDQRRQTS
jgi:hypothetical protein